MSAAKGREKSSGNSGREFIVSGNERRKFFLCLTERMGGR